MRGVPRWLKTFLPTDARRPVFPNPLVDGHILSCPCPFAVFESTQPIFLCISSIFTLQRMARVGVDLLKTKEYPRPWAVLDAALC